MNKRIGSGLSVIVIGIVVIGLGILMPGLLILFSTPSGFATVSFLGSSITLFTGIGVIVIGIGLVIVGLGVRA